MRAFKICKHCGDKFEKPTRYGKKQWAGRLFCSNKCSTKNRPVRWEHVRLMNEKRVESGYKVSEEHPNWKGNNVGYRALHRWVENHKGPATKCAECGFVGGSPKQVHWANTSGEYKRNLKDFIELCAKCHSSYDRGGRELSCLS